MKYTAKLPRIPVLVLGLVTILGATQAVAVQPGATCSPVQRADSAAPKGPASIDLMLFAHRTDIAPLRVPAATAAAVQAERR